MRESRFERGSAEGAGAIGGLAPAPFVFICIAVHRFMSAHTFTAVHSWSYF